MNSSSSRTFNKSKRRFALLLVLLPVVLHAQAVLPLRVGFYSSNNCKDPPNAALLHFDGRNLNGAHSAFCRDKVTRLGTHAYRLEESCPAEQQAKSAAAYPISSLRRLTAISATSFSLVDNGNENLPMRYRFCGIALDGHSSF